MKKPDGKVVLLGDMNVGKTSLLHRYMERRFQDTVSTVGGAFYLKQWGPYNISIWDTAGPWRGGGVLGLGGSELAAGTWLFHRRAQQGERGERNSRGAGRQNFSVVSEEKRTCASAGTCFVAGFFLVSRTREGG